MSYRDGINDLIAANGWNDETVLDLLWEYVDNQQAGDAVLDHFLRHSDVDEDEDEDEEDYEVYGDYDHPYMWSPDGPGCHTCGETHTQKERT